MKHKKIVISIIILIVLVLAGAILLSNKNIIGPGIHPAKQLSIQDKKITDNTKPFKIDITYPQIAGLDFFNKAVYDAVSKEISDFKTNSLENDAAVKKIDPVDYAKYPREYDLNITYTKGEIDEDIVSVVLNIYNFEGGAHGSNYFIPLNYGVNSKQKIKLADLFGGQPDPLQKISAFCIADLKKQMTASGAIGMTDDSWITRGAGPTEENYSVFLVNKNNIVFYFPQYQVAAGAAGDFEVTMPR